MASTSGDYQLAAAAAGFTIGFGVLTVWNAIKQTKRNKAPLRSAYIYMVWGEVLSNLVIAILGWLFLNGVLGDTAVVLFFILFCYVFEVQLLLQIIINRIAVIAEHRETATKLKWITAIIITSINIAVFCIWIPAHMNPPPNMTYVHINKYWDRVSKVLILIVDAALNWYFIHVVNARLVKHHGLKKYKSLSTYYARLGIVSVCMDIMLIGLMSLPNQTVYIQFHPVAYMVKLNIELSMADLIVKIARSTDDIDVKSSSHGTPFPDITRTNHRHDEHNRAGHDYVGGHGQTHTVHAGHSPASQLDEAARNEIKGITRQREVQVYVNDSDGDSLTDDSTTQDHKDPNAGFERHQSRHSESSQIPLKDLTPHGPYAC